MLAVSRARGARAAGLGCFVAALFGAEGRLTAARGAAAIWLAVVVLVSDVVAFDLAIRQEAWPQTPADGLDHGFEREPLC